LASAEPSLANPLQGLVDLFQCLPLVLKQTECELVLVTVGTLVGEVGCGSEVDLILRPGTKGLLAQVRHVPGEARPCGQEQGLIRFQVGLGHRHPRDACQPPFRVVRGRFSRYPTPGEPSRMAQIAWAVRLYIAVAPRKARAARRGKPDRPCRTCLRRPSLPV